MKKLSKVVFLGLIIFIVLSNSLTVKAETMNLAEKGWKEITGIQDVVIDKEWTIRFNRKISLDEIDEIKIMEGDILIPCNMGIKNEYELVVKAVNQFDRNTQYLLKIILKNGNKYFMKFNTEQDDFLSIDFNKDSLIKIEKDESKGFNFGYYLFIPKGADSNINSYILVEPNNTGTVSDDLSIHDDAAKVLVENGLPNTYAKELNIPLLVPIFSRAEQDWEKYTHALDTETMEIKEGNLKRIDLQLLNMVEDARKMLSNNGLKVNDKIFMSGFSASGNFTNRFATLHPNKIRAISSGGVNGMPIIPLSELDGHTLNYQVGVANLKELTGESFNLEEYKKIAQYIYMGALDRNDTLSYRDAYGKEEAQLTKLILGEDMLKDRWVRSQEIYKELDISSQMVTYEGTSHQVKKEMIDDIVKFFKLNGEIEEGIKKISPYEYDYIEYKELSEINITDADWANKQDKTDFFNDEKIIVLFIEEWLEGQDYSQLSKFLANLPRNDWQFTLKANGYSDVEAHLTGRTFSQEPRGFILGFSDEELENIVPGVDYTIHPHKSNDEYFFVVDPSILITK